ncbi:Stk1 family PASTA domain-containing Ser/Thr kinase [Streptomyces catenulae]|uniref:non-specific serine/threonine protein kinase n=1 Tax=Streptomyces catenulae TaxID=66875 RepID=A0ABV2Z8F0_9ACTN|nr:Stk1 family PASTA domain-containing Ser/Thr kinase [Streptomyces catenulae]
MDTTLQDPLVGQLLDGRYRVEARIAAGGMATVYRALDTRLDRVLALKVMHPSLAVDGAFVDRFIREAKSVAKLSHPNVVGVFDQGTDGTYVYLAMEYVAGCTLRDVLRERGALCPRAALDVLEPILAALGAAHRAGLVHRDMKPENVLIGDDGRVKVADFGLVRTVGAHTDTTGAVLGTVSYLAPEQIEDGTADARVDVYACGVVLYEMLTGAKPHTGGTAAQVLYRHLHEDVAPPSEAVPGLAAPLDALVALATARAAQGRPEDAVALLSAVREAREGLSDAQLDAAPPQAREVAAGDGTERTSVLPRAVVQPPLPGFAGLGAAPGEEGLNRTSRLEVPASEPTTRLRPAPPARRGPFADPRHRLVAIVAAVLLVLGGGTGIWYVTAGQFTAVPAVLDMAQAKAERTLRDEGLGVKVVRDYSPNVRRGHVMATAPGTGARIRGTGTVTLTVSRGPEIVAVPDLSGTPVADARRTLRERGLVPGATRREFSDEVAKGSVIRTDPAAGSERHPDTAVALTVSRGTALDVPDVTGDDRDDAAETLRDEGFVVKFADRAVHSPEDKGTVARQSPAGGQLGKGETVTLTLSLGPEMVTVPKVTGQNVDDAKKQLTDLGFSVEVKKPFLFPQDTVESQSVDPGEQAPKGSTITIKLKGAL